VSFASALFDVQFPPISYLIFALMGIAGTCAALGGFLFVLILFLSIFFGKDIEKADFNERKSIDGIPQGITLRHKREYSEKEVQVIHDNGGARGTVILIIALLVCFVLFYFANWQLLSSTWKVG
jgi:predicted RND superfamily exporter protein